MSTCNFSQPNLKYIYALTNEDFEEDGYSWKLDDIIEQLKAVKGFEIGEGWTDRDTKIIGKVGFEVYDKNYKQWDYASLLITLESGYYEGAKLDADFSELESCDIGKTLQKKIDRTVNRIEKILAANTMPIIRFGVFSNGEGVYEKVSPRSIIKALANN